MATLTQVPEPNPPQAGGYRLSSGYIVGQDANDLIAFYGGTPVAKLTVTGSKGANAALTSLMAALVSLNLVNDTTS